MSKADLSEFRRRLRQYLRQGEKSQEQLAFALSLEPATLSNKLSQKRGQLSQREKKELLLQLCHWRLIYSLAQLDELLDLLGESLDIFGSAELNQSPLNELKLKTNLKPLPLSSPSLNVQPVLFKDWEAAQSVPAFFGRGYELQVLEKWVRVEHCRLVTLLGLGGLGKTTLAIQLGQQIEPHFEYIKFCSLRDAPSVEEVVSDCLVFLAQPLPLEMPSTLEAKFNLLLRFLNQKCCLLILDNLETVMSQGEGVGQFLPGYEGYQKLLARLCHSEFQSTVILTSREKPATIATYEEPDGAVRSWVLDGMDENASRQLLAQVKLTGTSEAESKLIATYSGNPLKLKLAASHIRSLFASSIDYFLAEGEPIFGDIGNLLGQQFERLSELEQQLMYWLAIEREPVSLSELRQDVELVADRSEVVEALTGLERRSLLETPRDQTRFTLQPVIMEYVTHRLLQTFWHELLGRTEPKLLLTHALLKAKTREFVREIQTRLFLEPLLDRLMLKLKATTQIEQCLVGWLEWLRNLPLNEQGFGPGNLINLLYRLKGNLHGYNFTGLSIREAYLRGVSLQNTNFSLCHFSQTSFSGVFGSVLAIAISPTQNWLALGDVGGQVRVWNLSDDRLHQLLLGHTDRVRAIAFSPDGVSLASAGDDYTVRLWDGQSGKCLKIFEGHTDRVWAIAFSRDGRYLASAGGDSLVRVWRLWDGNLETKLTGHVGTVWALDFSPDNTTLVSSGQDTHIRMFHTDDWQCFEVLTAHRDEVTALAFSPDGTVLASGGLDREIKLWSTLTRQSLGTLGAYTNRIWTLAFSPDNTHLAVSVQHYGVTLWNWHNGQVVRTLPNAPHNQNWRLAFDSTGQSLATGCENQTIKLWDVRSGRCTQTLHSYLNRVGALAFDPLGHYLASGGEDCLVRLWDYERNECYRELVGHTNLVWALALSPDGTFLVSGSHDETVRVWNTADWQCRLLLEGHHARVWAVAVSPDSRLIASCGDDATVKLWDTTGKLQHVLKGHQDRVRSLAFSPAGDHLASCGDDGFIRLWSSRTGEALLSLAGHEGWVRSITFSPDGQQLASAGEDYSVKLWDVASGECRKTLVGHYNRVWSVAFSWDGEWLASASQDHSVRLWDVRSGQCRQVLDGHGGLVRVVAFDPLSQRLASGSEDESIRLWQTGSNKAIGVLRSPRLYEGMNIEGTQGLTPALVNDLFTLGAIV